MIELFFFQGHFFEFNALPTVFDEIADILMALAFGIAKDFQPIKIAEQIQCLLLIQIVQQREGKDLAGPFVDAGRIDEALPTQAIAEFNRMVIVVFADHRNRVLKTDRLVIFDLF